MHGASHAWFRLFWLCDVAAFIDGAHFGWEELVDGAADRGLARPVLQCALLAHELLRCPVSDAVVREAGQEAHVAWMTRVVTDRLVRRYDVHAPTVREAVRSILSRARLRRDWAYKRRVVDVVSLNVPDDWRSVPLPDRLFPLYRLLRLPPVGRAESAGWISKGAEVTAYLRALTGFARWRVVWVLTLLAALNVFEGVGVVLLVPLLVVAGVFDVTDGVDDVSAQVARVFDTVGVPQTLPVVLVLFIGLVCAREVVVRCQVRALDRLVEGFALQLRERLFLAITRVRWVFLTRTRSSDVLQVLTDEINRIRGGTHHLVQMASSTFMLAVYGLLALWVSPTLTALVSGVAVVVVWLLRGKLRLSHTRGRQTTQLGRKMYASISEHLGGMKVSKSFGAERRSVERFNETIRDIRRVS